MDRLKGKGAVILGAGSRDNIGQVIAKRVAAEGARVLVAGRDRDELRHFADDHEMAWAGCDINVADDRAALADAARSRLPSVDIVVNAVGVNLQKPYELTTEEEVRRVVDAHFVAPFMFFQAMIDVAAPGASLIQISSATATIMLNDHAAYMGSKAGFDHVIRCIANEFGGRGIRANSISPGLTESPMTAMARTVPGLWETYEAKYPLGRVGSASDIAAAVVWLSEDDCFMTGQNLQVNGGLTLRGNPSREELDAAYFRATGRARPRPWAKA